jgi:asparaginyl-tRNA synthetase
VGSSHQALISEGDDGTFFRSPKYLTVSGQLHLEALAQSVGNVWTLSPTFRAEKSDTARHLSEFYMLEAEMSFVDDMQVVMDLVRDLIQDITRPLLMSRVGNELIYGKNVKSQDGRPGTSEGKDLLKRWTAICGDWGQITYTEALNILQASSQQFEHAPKWGSGLQAEHERYLANTVAGGAPVFVTHYPKSIKPFYMLSSDSSDTGHETVDCFDLLVPEACEIVGGSMREHRIEHLTKSMQANNLIPPGGMLTDDQFGELKWYVDLRRWGSVPHGGFGLGFDRLLAYLAGVPNIREVVTFPRWVGRCDC